MVSTSITEFFYEGGVFLPHRERFLAKFVPAVSCLVAVNVSEGAFEPLYSDGWTTILSLGTMAVAGLQHRRDDIVAGAHIAREQDPTNM